MISGRIIIDTTAPTMDNNPWIVRHDAHTIEYIDIETAWDEERGPCIYEKKYDFVECNIEPYSIYKNNIKIIEPI